MVENNSKFGQVWTNWPDTTNLFQLFALNMGTFWWNDAQGGPAIFCKFQLAPLARISQA